jgi:hypothetical protein
LLSIHLVAGWQCDRVPEKVTPLRRPKLFNDAVDSFLSGLF